MHLLPPVHPVSCKLLTVLLVTGPCAFLICCISLFLFSTLYVYVTELFYVAMSIFVYLCLCLFIISLCICLPRLTATPTLSPSHALSHTRTHARTDTRTSSWQPLVIHVLISLVDDHFPYTLLYKDFFSLLSQEWCRSSNRLSENSSRACIWQMTISCIGDCILNNERRQGNRSEVSPVSVSRGNKSHRISHNENNHVAGTAESLSSDDMTFNLFPSWFCYHNNVWQQDI